MLINGIELSTLGIELYDRVLYSNDIDTKQEWLDGDIQPTFIRQQDKFKTINLEFLVLCQDEEEAFKRISRLTAMLKKATIKFDDLNFTFDVSLVQAAEPTRLKNGNFIVAYTLSSSYAKGQREIYTTNANMTNAFKLTVAYYQDSTTLLDISTVTIRASMFDKPNVTFEDLGIEINKFLPEYYNSGVITNFNGLDLTYENLQSLQVLNINYAPITYSITVNYYLDNGQGLYNEILQKTISFTHAQLTNYQTIGQLVNVSLHRPAGYKAKVNYDKPLTLENLLTYQPISVFYDKIETPRSKNILISYKLENDEGEYETQHTTYINISEETLYDGTKLSDIISIDAYRPAPAQYNAGYIDGHTSNELITYDTIETAYSIIYTRATSTLFVEYYAGTYPDWYRLTTATIQVKYKQSFETGFNVLTDLGIDFNKYNSAPYKEGRLYNADNYKTYEDVLNAGVLQVYYEAIDYPITVQYYLTGLDSEPTVETININALMFFGNPLLSDIIPIAEHRPEGYQFDENFSYNGELTLEAITQAQPISIVYQEISAVRTKNIIVRYKQELSAAYSTIATNLITVSEADIVGGTRLKDIISLNAYQPEYYETGIIDGASSTAIVKYDELASEYNVLYVAASYTTPVRYYLDEVNDEHWIGSSTITYRVIDFTTSTTLYDFGLSLNMFKPAYGSDGELLYSGPVNFSTLLETESINVMYKSVEEPDDPDGIDYPHRFLFLQHNDLGEYEHLHPEWTMNHAFINTGISADDMSKLTIIMECDRVDENVPLYQVNAGYGYLFGSYSPFGAFYMRYNNQTMYGENLSGVNLYEAKAGAKSNVLSLAESAAVGFSGNTGIYSSAQEGYSRAVFTYSHTLPTDGAQMPQPIYLFANNYNGNYSNGLAGIGIYSCRIYYNDQLVRDFIPVQFYDKIGNKVAPSNCLYDKVTETFFEDGTGLNSFNIRDDESYVDDNLAHKIGYCYVNYYKGEELLKTTAVYFRGDDFDEENEFDLYERFKIDENQPQYTKAGIIRDIASIRPTFDGLNGQVITVYYEPITSIITVNYYQEIEGHQNILATEEIALQEKDFYSVPTFGDLVRLNKYKPLGYETDFTYPGLKVSFSRVLENSPYNIVYKKMEEEPIEYTTTIRYIKKVFGVREYELIGEKILTFNQSDFRDGEYIDFYIDKNEMKPERFYLDGITYQWYEMDERLDTPENLKENYTIAYMPERQFLDVDYYTDEIHEDNLIASTTWGLSIDELEPSHTYSIIDILPNSYINKFKPVNCLSGVIDGVEIQHTFESLIEQGHINIVYETKEEPDDPTDMSREKKVLGFGTFKQELPLRREYSDTLYNGGIIPYIDLGYKPKELGRLKVEIKAVAQANGLLGSPCTGGWQDTSYVDFFGYKVPRAIDSLGQIAADEKDFWTEDDLGNFYSSYIDNTLKGHFSCSTRVPLSTGWVYTAEGPQFVDGQNYYVTTSGPGVISGKPKWVYYGTDATFRRGLKNVYDENWEIIECYRKYGFEEEREIKSSWIVNPERFDTAFNAMANPITTILDAYNGYWSSYTEEDSNHAPYEIFENEDKDIFEARMQPKGSLTLFRTRNALTGDVNICAINPDTRQTANGGLSGGYVPNALKGNNPYTGEYKEIEYEVLVQVGTDADGNALFETKKMNKNIKYSDYPLPVFPQLEACAIWSVKVWDRDRLVRDLIPVAKGEKIYDYIMPENGLFDLVTEIFFGNSNEGGTYKLTTYFNNENPNGPQLLEGTQEVTIAPEEVLKFWVIEDPSYYGKIIINYYNYNYDFIANQFVDIPTWYSYSNTTIEEIVGFNDYKPDDFHLDGFLDIDDKDSPLYERLNLKELYELSAANVLYKLRTFTKTVVYYQGDYRIGSKDIFYSLQDIENANNLEDLGIDVDLYWTEDFAHGKIIFNENIITEGNIQAFIDAPSPIVVYEKLSKEEAPNLLYVEYYRGGAYDDTLITPDPDDENYFDCNLDGVVLNPNGAIKYYNHYHSALYEDEKFDYFIPYQVKVLNKYIGIHRGPARKFPTLATIVEKPILTITEERNGWGRLKEYPVGWIMLNATERVVGPGQNPDYDVPDAETATIPFTSEVHITKLTVDRLWCYVPEVESWVKAEDISYNQSGKLYNALDLQVIHLDEIDFSNVSSLNDMGIYPNKRALYFHEKEDYVYDGEYTYEAFSNIHNIDFVYPEIIYNYSCIYYKDHASPWMVGEGEALCNPPTETGKVNIRPNPSYTDAVYAVPKGGILVLTGQPITNDEGTWYPVRHIVDETIYEGYMDVLYLDIIKEPADEIYQTDSELGRASFSCSLSDWNPDWDTFIATSWKVDEDGNEIAPTLYRSIDLTLTWDYFGFDKNLYKPDGYSDGIYLWNPRSWNSDGDIRFTFYELVRCGTQKVVYPCINPNQYKIWTYPNSVNRYKYSNSTYYGFNPGIPVDFSTENVNQWSYVLENDKYERSIDIYTEWEIPPAKYLRGQGRTEGEMYGGEQFTVDLEKNTITLSGLKDTGQGWYTTGGTYNPTVAHYGYRSGMFKQSTLNGGPGYTYCANWSNFRNSPTSVYGISNGYNGQPWDYFIGNNLEKITDITKLSGHNQLRENYPTQNVGGSLRRYDGYIQLDGDYSTTASDYGTALIGIIHKAQSFENFEMKHYWVPAPKGLWYTFNGKEERIPENGLFDILTGEFRQGYKTTNGSIGTVRGGYWEDPKVVNYGREQFNEYLADGINLIYLKDEVPDYNHPFNYFDDWHYATTDIDYIVKVGDISPSSFVHPDIYATKVRELPIGLVLPVSKVTSDAENRVIGEWYFSSNQWFESNKAEIYAGTFDKSKLTKLQQTIALVAPGITQSYYVYLDPSEVAEPGEASSATYSNTGYSTTAYYNYVDTNGNKFYFDGQYWIPELYTQFNTVEHNKNYAIIPDTLSYYSLPIEEDGYVSGQYHYGERITVLYTAGQDQEWGYTGLGWIRINHTTVSEVL